MPVFRSGPGEAPAWCQLERFEVIALAPGKRRRFRAGGSRQRVFVTGGQCFLDLDGDDVTAEAISVCELVWLSGHWGDETGGAGVFQVARAPRPNPAGDPYDYPKETGIDRHYHDCDEYWIVLEGGGRVSSENRLYDVGPGDCLATGMGHHHDFPIITAPVRAVWFETTLEGRKRRGHLWEHTHGHAEPQLDRV